MAIDLTHAQTVYPPSFGGELLLFMFALGSLTALAFLELMVAGWMARDIWRDRLYVHPKTALTAFRVLLLLSAGTGCVRKLPEAVYMYSWNEVDPATLDLILLFKRLADSLAFVPGTGWIILLVLSYPTIASALKSHSDGGGDLLSPWPGLARPALALVLIFVIAGLVAVSKLYLQLA